MNKPTFEMSGRHMSRRTFLAGTGVTMLSAAVLTACSASPTPSASTASGKAAAGGEMHIARPPASSAETLDPASPLSAYEYLGALFNKLTKLDKSGTVQPDLAESWTPSADAKTWTFALRKGVTWHDGKPFTAQDVVYTIGHILDPATKSPQAGVLNDFIKPSSVTAKDTLTVVFNLESANAEFPSLMTSYNCYIIPDGSGATIGKTGIGTGPFKLASFTPAGPGRVVRNPHYYGGRATLDAIAFSSIPDTQARVNALLAGQVDLISQTNLDYATAQTVKASPIATISTLPNAQWYSVPMLNTAAPFTDPLVRLAFCHAYDPKSALQLVEHGNGTIGQNNPVPPTEAFFLDYGTHHDPEQAKALLKKAGHSAMAMDIYTSSYDAGLTPLALAMKGSMAAAGITLNVKNVAADSYYTNVWMKKPLMTTYWYTGRPIDQLLNQIYRSGSSYNESAFSDTKFDAILDQARATVDDGKRKQLYQDAQRALVDAGPSMTPFFADRLVGLSKKVVGYDEHGFEFDYVGIGLSA